MKNQTFGIEIETTGLGRERTAKAIAAFFGTQARYVNHHLGDWHIPMPDGRKWIVERDASVTDPAAEVVSPVCCWEDIEMVQAVVRCIKQAGARVEAQEADEQKVTKQPPRLPLSKRGRPFAVIRKKQPVRLPL